MAGDPVHARAESGADAQDAARGAVHGQAEPAGAEGRLRVDQELAPRVPLDPAPRLRLALSRVR
eukprot:2668197-Rhodomonas_salina.1